MWAVYVGVCPGVPVCTGQDVSLQPCQQEKQIEWSTGDWQSGGFGSGSVLDWLCDLGVVPALSGSSSSPIQWQSCTLDTQLHPPGQAGMVLWLPWSQEGSKGKS